jgi:hypothetical protein
MYGKFKGRIEAWLPVIHCWTIRDGKVIAWRSLPGRGVSLEAAVLEDEAGFGQGGVGVWTCANEGRARNACRIGVVLPHRAERERLELEKVVT